MSHAEGWEAHAWGAHGVAELDLVLSRGAQRVGFEFKCAERPRMAKSMAAALQDLRLSHIYVVYPGAATSPLSEGVAALSLRGGADFRFLSDATCPPV